MLELFSFLAIVFTLTVLMFMVSSTMKRIKKLENENISRGVQRLTDYNHMTDKLKQYNDGLSQGMINAATKADEAKKASHWFMYNGATGKPEEIPIKALLQMFINDMGYKVDSSIKIIKKGEQGRGECEGKEREKTIEKKPKN